MSVTELKNSGLPLCIDDETHIMYIGAELGCEFYGRKYAGAMKGLLADETNMDPDEPFYDVYREIAYPTDVEAFKKNFYRYDVTVVLPGLLNGECKKTSGHYHGWNEMRTNTFGEVYEVLKGTALYILQRADNFDGDPKEIKIDDMIAVTVNAGETLVVPPNYGHASINVGEGPLVFGSLAYYPCPINYDSVKYYHGMGYYVFKEGNEVKIKLNDKYEKVPELKMATVKENPNLGIQFDVPVYHSYLKNPEAFRFLAQPDAYVEEIMGMLCLK